MTVIIQEKAELGEEHDAITMSQHLGVSIKKDMNSGRCRTTRWWHLDRPHERTDGKSEPEERCATSKRCVTGR